MQHTTTVWNNSYFIEKTPIIDILHLRKTYDAKSFIRSKLLLLSLSPKRIESKQMEIRHITEQLHLNFPSVITILLTHYYQLTK